MFLVSSRDEERYLYSIMGEDRHGVDRISSTLRACTVEARHGIVFHCCLGTGRLAPRLSRSRCFREVCSFIAM